ncbi:hypothetical protein JCM5353_004237 [Sporobolomyces roseus]
MFTHISKFVSLFTLVLSLSFSICHAERVGPSRLDSLQKRSSIPSQLNNKYLSKRLTSSGFKVKNSNLVTRDVKVGASKPVLAGRSVKGSAASSPVEKRQTGIDPMVKIGDSNPKPTNQQLNQVGDSAPLEGKANGSMAPFKKRSPVPNPSDVANLNKRYPNPIAQPHYINEISHLLATRGNADGSIEYF